MGGGVFICFFPFTVVYALSESFNVKDRAVFCRVQAGLALNLAEGLELRVIH